MIYSKYGSTMKNNYNARPYDAYGRNLLFSKIHCKPGSEKDQIFIDQI